MGIFKHLNSISTSLFHSYSNTSISICFEQHLVVYVQLPKYATSLHCGVYKTTTSSDTHW